ncbi:SAM-dependent methyltransferase [Catenulispora yoronensis]|uniref:SAM-dependent methyltransferase n=1 Tax=Catenulispora yoronensis TaxID=450799 RepID=A0ABP5FX89_9ACTN
MAENDSARRGGTVPAGVDIERSSVARLYDWLLGGSHNFASDRELGRRLVRAEPNARQIVRENRDFLGRSVRYLLDQGIRQFLDLGSGIPTQENVHQIVQKVAPGARVVYVDNDPSAVAHSRHILAGNPDAAAVHADMRHSGEVMGHPTTRGLLDFSRPIGLLMVTVLHFVPDADEPHAMVARYRDAVVPGSYLAISHATHEAAPRAAADVEQLYRSTARASAHTRSHEEISGFFAGFELVEPGLVYIPLWHPEGDPHPNPEQMWFYAGVGRLDQRSRPVSRT